MGHFVVHVLAESKLLRVNTDFNHILLNASHEIGQGLIGDDSLINCFTDGDKFSCFTVHLIASRVQECLGRM